MSLFLGEAAGARILRANVGVTDITAGGTTPVLLEIETHDLYPAGGTADLIFRSADVAIRSDQGYAVDVTPIVDGADAGAQSFNAPAPIAGTDGVAEVQAFVAQRGTRLAVRIEQTAAAGDVEVLDATAAWQLIRQTP